ncbi:MoxR family ATPase [Lewinella sp. W8]|uniref:AAA family ATPase n=1 Tax=Lewinella sp. W8 TaxID=2528208 RepID=UPI001067D95E|nr:MoxR family ATPase [Lewinella sp. W8]MTB50265.1 AAA family ATPase [Lewinella sp. W8]
MSFTIRDARPPAFEPAKYILTDELRLAVETAIALGQPLLVTGAPGTGKTELAYKVAADLAAANDAHGLNFAPTPHIFNTKTTVEARDLFYTYDALGHFRAANLKEGDAESAQVRHFLKLQALGLAIARSRSDAAPDFPLRGEEHLDQSSVVLIDEIDKAPRDLPNDLLNEIKHYTFEVREQGNRRITANPERRIVIIMTSNSEKNLPNAFLRRCVFHHIERPDAETLLRIAKAQLGEHNRYTESALKDLIKYFQDLQAQDLRKKPSTAELIAWLRMLAVMNPDGKIDNVQPGIHQLSILVKTEEDRQKLRELYG